MLYLKLGCIVLVFEETEIRCCLGPVIAQKMKNTLRESHILMGVKERQQIVACNV